MRLIGLSVVCVIMKGFISVEKACYVLLPLTFMGGFDYQCLRNPAACWDRVGSNELFRGIIFEVCAFFRGIL